MNTPKGKRIAIALTTIGVATVVAAGVAMKDLIQEEWYIYKLWSNDENQIAKAANALGDLGSVRAVPKLINLSIWSANYEGIFYDNPGISLISRGHSKYSFWIRRPACEAIKKIGLKCVPFLVFLLSSNNQDQRIAAAFALGEIGKDSISAIPTLKETLLKADDELREICIDSINKILNKSEE